MKAKEVQVPAQSKPARSFSLLGFFLFAVVALRAYTYHSPIPSESQSTNPLAHTLFLAPILVLLLTDPALFSRFPHYPWIYFPLQIVLITGLGLVWPYQDIWGFLYVVLAIQAIAYLAPSHALQLITLISASYLITLTFTLGVSVGLALGFSTLAGAAVMVSYEVIFKQARAAERESQRLVNELQEATAQLRAYTAQAEELAATRERDRLAGQLHDSISQTVFSISLQAQSIRLLQEKDPGQVVPQLAALQDLTGSALTQMRSLIQQWRPPAGS